eukprot:10144733-Heterocapsa_arctica.AAC.1
MTSPTQAPRPLWRSSGIEPYPVGGRPEAWDELRGRDDADEVPVEVLKSPSVASSKGVQRTAELRLCCPA